ncbi:MAG: malto-oligosyltrehalose trehalohydrolase [Myxococcales bacterium]
MRIPARRLPVGGELVEGRAHFRVWAPRWRAVEVIVDGRATALSPEEGGYHAGFAQARSGSRYGYRLDGEGPFPDPASRSQPDGPHALSALVDPGTFAWNDQGFPGVRWEGQVAYELHVGTFTGAGTWNAAARELPRLRELGVTVIEMMPVAEFPGEFGWGYDSVDLFAPTRLYGSPDDLRRFVDCAHENGLGVILDVVYNHLGPDGNYLARFSPQYFSTRYKNEWGEPLNFDGEGSSAVREFFLANAGYWIDEFHIDGLRLDATQQIFDASEPHILCEIEDRVRKSARGRGTAIIVENEAQDTRLLRPRERGGCGFDAAWNDDFHHTARVAATGVREAYYVDYGGTPQELVSAAKRGYLYQGQNYTWQKKRRGTPALDLSPRSFVTYLQNHDQVANSSTGERLHQITAPGVHRALTAVLLLSPATPLLFQGQEWNAPEPFVYFADHRGELASSVRRGRAAFLTQFRSVATDAVRAALSDPCARETFDRCKLDRSRADPRALLLHRDLLALRREDLAVLAGASFDGAVLSERAFLLRWSGAAERLLVVNLGPELLLAPAPEPLLAPPSGMRWRLLWSSEDPRYGGRGSPEPESDEGAWHLSACCAALLKPEPRL